MYIDKQCLYTCGTALQIDEAREKGLDELLHSIRHALGESQRDSEVLTEMLESKLDHIQVTLNT
jgi:hypothetical protein